LAVEADAIESYIEAGKMYLQQVLEHRKYAEPFVGEIRAPKKGKPPDRTIYRLAAENGKGILFCSNLDHVDEELKLFADVVEVLPSPTSRQLHATFRRFGHSLTKSEEQLVAAETWTRLTYSFLPDRPIVAGLRRLRETAERPPATKARLLAEGPSLADLSGLGEIKEWGFELACDLVDFRAGAISWDELDTGALVSGPPGSGKTLFASALARTCDIPIVTASAAQWQATGYLNDLLQAMRDSFIEAKAHGIALLFIDEIDAIGSREARNTQHADYTRQVINSLLELLDGFERRSGVIVVGATNHPESLDHALLRPGRLDRHFRIPLPDARAREQIFEFYAKLPVPNRYREHFSRSTAGMAGAGIKQLVRDAKRLARRSQKPFEFADVVKVVKPLIPVSAEQMRLAAFHEAGHAIVGLELGMQLEGIKIVDTVVDGNVNALGGALFNQPAFPLKTRSFFLDHIAMYLGGIAAEVLIYGEFTESVADSHSSDLALATALATRLEGCFGMGTSLAIEVVQDQSLSALRANDFRLRSAVRELLDQEFKRASSILNLRLDALREISDALCQTKSMSVDAIRDVLSRHPAKTENRRML
jgi:hypothetical protein